MNIIKTVADLQKALSAYPGELPLQLSCQGELLTLDTDLQLFQVSHGDGPSRLMVELQPSGERVAFARADPERLREAYAGVDAEAMLANCNTKIILKAAP